MRALLCWAAPLLASACHVAVERTVLGLGQKRVASDTLTFAGCAPGLGWVYAWPLHPATYADPYELARLHGPVELSTAVAAGVVDIEAIWNPNASLQDCPQPQVVYAALVLGAANAIHPDASEDLAPEEQQKFTIHVTTPFHTRHVVPSTEAVSVPLLPPIVWHATEKPRLSYAVTAEGPLLRPAPGSPAPVPDPRLPDRWNLRAALARLPGNTVVRLPVPAADPNWAPAVKVTLTAFLSAIVAACWFFL